ncbi:hypothetical protein MTO96_038874 [Rhipicephalus appendiculatus]
MATAPTGQLTLHDRLASASRYLGGHSVGVKIETSGIKYICVMATDPGRQTACTSPKQDTTTSQVLCSSQAASSNIGGLQPKWHRRSVRNALRVLTNRGRFTVDASSETHRGHTTLPPVFVVDSVWPARSPVALAPGQERSYFLRKRRNTDRMHVTPKTRQGSATHTGDIQCCSGRR